MTPDSHLSHLPPPPPSPSLLQLHLYSASSSIHMDSLNPNRSKFARTIHKVIHLRTPAKLVTHCGKDSITPHKSKKFHQDDDADDDDSKLRSRAVLEALVAKLFASVSTIKAGYAEMQAAQSPYDVDAIQVADKAVVRELRLISELKQSFLKKQLDLSLAVPQVTVLLAEIQEQQSLMKTYEITMKKLESEMDLKDSHIDELKKRLQECNQGNKVMEKRLNSSGPLPFLDNLKLSLMNPNHFCQVLHYAVRSIRRFVKFMSSEMESAHWDMDAAAKSIVPDTVLAKPTHRCFAFESFVCRAMFEGFNSPNFSLSESSSAPEGKGKQRRQLFFERFKKLKSVNPIHFLSQNPRSTFGKFVRAKYLSLVHAKMECSFFGNLNQRKLLNAGSYPETAFFAAFAEMAKRVWVLHGLAFSFDVEIGVFQVSHNSRFSEVYMECVTEDAFDTVDGDLRVGFTVVPGFKIGSTVVQCQVYLSPAATAPADC
ncbi:protein GRAVITROPIC IN THE LIGHT 1 [Vitis riparia]|uniref:protein GRAVITROPIC IN THE LIGHT 1 n=1 Tax=Vitis riparia TaxID=96939 RepID=UPI00155AED8C|nr:protein GRAVITROPIC IN THE LIGHT 1 [Vitis riparia]